jgi:hypothetical protein
MDETTLPQLPTNLATPPHAIIVNGSVRWVIGEHQWSSLKQAQEWQEDNIKVWWDAYNSIKNMKSKSKKAK